MRPLLFAVLAGFFLHGASAFIFIFVSLAALGIGIGGIFVEQGLLDRLTRLERINEDMSQMEFDNLEEAEVSDQRAEAIEFVKNGIARRLGWEDFDDFFAEIYEFEHQANASSELHSEYLQNYKTDKNIRMAAMLGSSLSTVFEWKLHKHQKKWGGVYQNAFNSKMRELNKARVYIHRAQQDLDRRIFKGDITFDEALELSELYEGQRQKALNNADNFKIDPKVLSELDKANAKKRFQRLRKMLRAPMHKTLAVVDGLGKMLEIFDFFASLVTIIKDAKAKPKVEAAIRDGLWLRFVGQRKKMENGIWKQFETQITALEGTWLSLHDNIKGTSTCFAGIDKQLADESDRLLGEMFEKFDNLTDHAVYDALVFLDQQHGANLDFDPSKAELFDILASHGQLDTREDEEDDVDDTNIFDEDPGPEIPAANINGSNVQYVEFANGAGAMWKLAGPFWTVQEKATEESTKQGIPARFGLVQQERTGTKVRFLLDTIETQNVTGKVEIELLIEDGAGSLEWPDRESRAIDPSTSSNLIPTNGWTVWWSQSILPESPIFFQPQEFEQCSRAQGWDATTWEDQETSNLREIARNKTYVIATTSKDTATGVKFGPARIDLNLEEKLMTFHDVIVDFDTLQFTPIDEVLPLDEDSLMPKLYVA